MWHDRYSQDDREVGQWGSFSDARIGDFCPCLQSIRNQAQPKVYLAQSQPYFYSQGSPCPEYRCADFLSKLCHEHDVLLDIHSAHTDGLANVFQNYLDDKHTALAKATGIGTIIQGRPSVYQDVDAMDTCRYMYSLDKLSVLVGCGQHNDPRAGACAYVVIENILVHLGLL
ncbi:MAG: hypothetical protein NZL83_00375 [Candidatus Absconditabacterales bacterium]|nr:hypothetical protein [Candidatus Absconditabacterales bacterium]